MNAWVKSRHGKPEVSLCVCGAKGAGKTTLTAAIVKLLAKEAGTSMVEQLERASMEGTLAYLFSKDYEEYETEHRRYHALHVDGAGSATDLKTLLRRSALLMNGALVVVSAEDGPTGQTEDQLQVLSRAAVLDVVVFVNKVDAVRDPKRLQALERDLRALLDEHEFMGHEVDIIRGSARRALEGAPGDVGEGAIRKLTQALDRSIPAWDT